MRDLLVHLVAQGATMSSEASLRKMTAYRVPLVKGVIVLLRQVQTLVRIVNWANLIARRPSVALSVTCVLMDRTVTTKEEQIAVIYVL